MHYNPVSLILKKKSGQELSHEELDFLVSGFVKGEIPDYQISSFLMATCWQGMTPTETRSLVRLMRDSGKILDLSSIKRPKIDKHSTGGIGDKTTLILAPLLASLGFAFPTIAGRGLAHTGGTVDKLEAIPGFSCRLSHTRFKELISSTGLAFLSQTEDICPADRKLYALRDVTGTVESLPLIVASILSKKLAEGIDGIVFDVKCGSGAFMKNSKQAKALAQALVKTAREEGKVATALITDMSAPLGHAVGNAIEVNEVVAFLRRAPHDPKPQKRLEVVTMALAEALVFAALKVRGDRRLPSKKAVRAQLDQALQSGQAYAKFLEIVSMQGGNREAVDHGLTLAPVLKQFTAATTGNIHEIDGVAVGMALVQLGGGRRKTSDKINPGVGFWFHQNLGDSVKKGARIATIYASSEADAKEAQEALKSAISIKSARKALPSLLQQQI